MQQGPNVSEKLTWKIRSLLAWWQHTLLISHFSKSWIKFSGLNLTLNPIFVSLFHCVCVFENVCNLEYLAKTPFAQNHEEVEIVQPDSAFARVQCSGSQTQSRRGHSRNRHQHINMSRRNRGHDSSIWYLQKWGERWDERERVRERAQE